MTMHNALIVGDSTIMPESIMECLSTLYTCEVASNGQDAIDKYINAFKIGKMYSLVLIYLEMPAMNGAIAIKKIRDCEFENLNKHYSQIILVTSCAELNDTLSDLHKFNFFGWIQKPITKDKLLNAISKAEGISCHFQQQDTKICQQPTLDN